MSPFCYSSTPLHTHAHTHTCTHNSGMPATPHPDVSVSEPKPFQSSLSKREEAVFPTSVSLVTSFSFPLTSDWYEGAVCN